MEQSFFSFKTNDGIEVSAIKWEAEDRNKPIAIVQLAHGMAEHIHRYADFSQYLVNENIYVYGNDHRGHGKTGRMNHNTGYFADEEGFEKVVKDMHTLTTIIENEYPNVPIFLLGHSMGSFLARRYIQLFGDKLSGVILSGTGGDPGIMGKIGRMIASREIKKKGRRTPSPLLNKLTFGSYNKGFQPNRTEFDWLSRNKDEVDKYISDPDCGGIFTAGFFHDLLWGLEIIHKPNHLKDIPRNLPIFLISGSKDPVGNNSKGVLKTYKSYERIGINDLSCHFYDNARHEILNETNKQEVYEDILNWLNRHL